MAIFQGANALGLVSKMPSGPGVISDETIALIARFIPPGVSSFLLSSETTSEAIISHHKRTFTNTIQLVDAIPLSHHKLIKQALPAVKLVQVIHVSDEKSIHDALAIQSYADAILLDSGNPFLDIKQSGGTGKVHNWEISRKIVEQVNIPVFLAGGLNADNVREAIDTVQPFGVDVCSGVRTNGKLDESKLEAFIEAVRR
jgi:phosphoribosylanthranilate isomerase